MIGRTISHYTVLEKLGEGGMGVVYKAQDSRLNRPVALKVLPPDKVADPERRRRFVQEARAASALNHPNIVTIYDIDEAGGVHFIAMEYVTGRTLAQLVGLKGLPLDEALKYAVQLADALASAHGAGIIHRDLKPGNVMVTEGGLVKVLDFGLAKLAEAPPASGESASTQTMLARTGESVIVGTAAYMSPEQAEAKPVDGRSDIFSFGALLYEVASGRRAFQRDSTISTLAAILCEDPEPLRNAPPEIAAVVHRCLRKRPEERYQGAKELKLALEKACGEAARRGAAPGIAVLPFANLSADKENEYFSDGLAEEIINALTKLPGLRVTARTSAFVFRDQAQDVREIGARLGVDHILEGSVRRAGNRIRVTAQLIAASDGCHLWSERYDRDMSDVFAIQDEIAQAIAGKLRVQLAVGQPLVRKPTANLEAYNLYLQGRHLLYRFTPEAFAGSKECFEKAIALDPDFALAYDGLSEFYWWMAFLGVVPPKETFSLGMWAALRALEIDNTLAEAHAQLGIFRKELDYNWGEVDREFRQALELNPTSPTVRLRHALASLMPVGRLEEAAAELEEVLRSDPLSLFARFWLAFFLYLRRLYDRAIAQVRHMLELDPNYDLAYMVLGEAYGMKGMWSEAVAAFEKGAELSGRTPLMLSHLGWACGRVGREEEARSVLAELEGRARVGFISPACIGLIHVGLGEMDKAFEWFEKAIDIRDPLIVPIKSFPHLDPLRSDPRFRALLRKMNLEA